MTDPRFRTAHVPIDRRYSDQAQPTQANQQAPITERLTRLEMHAQFSEREAARIEEKFDRELYHLNNTVTDGLAEQRKTVSRIIWSVMMGAMGILFYLAQWGLENLTRGGS